MFTEIGLKEIIWGFTKSQKCISKCTNIETSWFWDFTCTEYMYSHLHGVLHCILFLSRELLKCFTTTELINWKQLCTTYESELKFGSASSPATHVFNTKLEGGAKRWTDLKNRVVEHVSIWYATLTCCIMMYWEVGGDKKGVFLDKW